MNEQIQPSHPLTDAVRSTLWAVLVIGVVGNVVASAASASIGVHVVLGAITAAAATGLVVVRNRGRA